MFGLRGGQRCHQEECVEKSGFLQTQTFCKFNELQTMENDHFLANLANVQTRYRFVPTVVPKNKLQSS